MRVDYLFIIGIVPKVVNTMTTRETRTDTLECMSALMQKYKSRCRSVASLSFNYPEDYHSANDWEVTNKVYMTKTTGLAGSFQEQDSHYNGLVPYGVSPDELSDEISPGERVGVYLIGNYARTEYVLESMMVEPVADMLKSLGLPRLDKLCLVACGAARVGRTTKENKKFPSMTQNANEECFIYNLCRHLAPLTPMIAGWDGYVEVSTQEHKRGAIGSKFQDPGVQKRVIQFADGAPQWRLDRAGWSDKA